MKKILIFIIMLLIALTATSGGQMSPDNPHQITYADYDDENIPDLIKI